MSHAALLSLPPELRNTIYQLVTETTTTVRLTLDGEIAEHPLAAVCQQLRQEFSPVWRHKDNASIEIIRATVINYDFGKVMRAMKPFEDAYARWEYPERQTDGAAERDDDEDADGEDENEDDEDDEYEHEDNGEAVPTDPGPEPPFPKVDITLRFTAPLLSPARVSRGFGAWIEHLAVFYCGPGGAVARYRAEVDWEVYRGVAFMQLVNESLACYHDNNCCIDVKDMGGIEQAFWVALRERDGERAEGVRDRG